AERGRQAERAIEVARLAELLPERPAEALAQLRDISDGCLYLINQWELVASVLDEKNSLWPSQRSLAIHLLGTSPSCLFTSDDSMEITRAFLGCVMYPGSRLPYERAVPILEADRPDSMDKVEFRMRVEKMALSLPERSAAVATLKKRVAAEIGTLKKQLTRVRRGGGGGVADGVGGGGAPARPPRGSGYRPVAVLARELI